MVMMMMVCMVMVARRPPCSMGAPVIVSSANQMGYYLFVVVHRLSS